ncbi:MAG: thioredoxin domain-containing protein [Syntrophales bacterium]
MTNRLHREKSPYLIQHAANPVDWYPWGEEAFERASREDKPVFFSSGYSTCHWCHVMAHESFEDPDVAALMNEAFVCIKVDREERPDIDKFYMTAAQMMTGGGGWPLTILMTPEKRPFFAATYIPKDSRFGRTGLRELIPQASQVWKDRRGEIIQSATQILALLKKEEQWAAPEEPLGATLADEAYEDLMSRYDETWGGFGPPPKFPMPHQLVFLLRYGKTRGKEKAVYMAADTLRLMRAGGICDHLGYGFHRYSTDRQWLLPHFEKMLYDQALLCLAYAEAFQATGEDVFDRTAREIITYVLRDMTAPEGGFYCAEDADSEGKEGKFYLWTEEEIENILGKEEAELFVDTYGLEKEGNFTEEATGRRTGENILHRLEAAARLTSGRGITESALEDKLAKARERLFAARERRVHPGKDDKILTDWNGLMIAALARAAAVFAEPSYYEAACRAYLFIEKNLSDSDGSLRHRWRDGEASARAFADDYAFLIWGLLECYDYSGDSSFLASARSLQDILDRHFWDEEQGGYFMSADDHTDIPVRPKETHDGAIPSGNSVAFNNLIRLHRLTGEDAYAARAGKLGRAFSGLIDRSPSSHTMFMIALTLSMCFDRHKTAGR